MGGLKQNESSLQMKMDIASARKKAAFARGVRNRTFESADDALPALVSAYRTLLRVINETANNELTSLGESLSAGLLKISTCHEKYMGGEASNFSRKEVDAAVATIHRASVILDKFRLRSVAGRKERVVAKVVHSLIFAAFGLLFSSVAVGLVLGLSHPDYDEGLTGSYYTNASFGGHRFQTIDHKIDFKWGNKPPIKGIPRNRFSIKWEGCVRVDNPQGMYLAASADDDIRVYIDGDLLIDTWDKKNYEVVNSADKIERGVHPVEIQYRQDRGPGHVYFGWTPDGEKSVVVPPENLIPRTMVLGGSFANDACPDMPRLKQPGKQKP